MSVIGISPPALVEVLLSLARSDATIQSETLQALASALADALPHHTSMGRAEARTWVDQLLARPALDCAELLDNLAGADVPMDERIFLRSIEVTGFRGIGGTSRVELDPLPGLTVISGRNGCGKSSFAEALEVAMTGSSKRWRTKPHVWTRHWRNVHHDESAQVSVDFAHTDGGMRVDARWGDDEEWHEPERTWSGAWSERPWHEFAQQYRPLLAHDELNEVFDEPSKLHDALSTLAGLDVMVESIEYLQREATAVRQHRQEALAQKERLLRRLTKSTDPRSEQLQVLLQKRRIPFEKLRRAALDSVSAADGDGSDVLRRVVRMRLPDLTAWDSHRGQLIQVRRLRESLEPVADAELSGTHQLLRQALQWQASHDNCSCPLCGQGQLDSVWRRRTEAILQKSQRENRGLLRLRRQEDQLIQELAERIPEPSAALRELAGMPTSLGERAAQACLLWEAWQQGLENDPYTDDPRPLLDSLLPLLDEIASTAEQQADVRDQQWQELAFDVAAWVSQYQHVFGSQGQAARRARSWLVDTSLELKNERLTPYVQESREIWSHLRHESNVDLDGLTLHGSNTRRRVNLTAAVDGVPVGALGVMSQGELHALALALFLPQAARPESPWGFLVVDDPVQAMDPAKVEGLVEVLKLYSRTRQVVVLTHDDRVPDAIRRMQVPAKLIEVSRGHSSRVHVSAVMTPHLHYLDDARVLASDIGMVDSIRRRAIALLCRQALESASHDRYFREHLKCGVAYTDLEERWNSARDTRSKLRLLIRDVWDESLDDWAQAKMARRSAIAVAASAPHEGLRGNVTLAINRVENTIREILG